MQFAHFVTLLCPHLFSSRVFTVAYLATIINFNHIRSKVARGQSFRRSSNRYALSSPSCLCVGKVLTAPKTLWSLRGQDIIMKPTCVRHLHENSKASPRLKHENLGGDTSHTKNKMSIRFLTTHVSDYIADGSAR